MACKTDHIIAKYSVLQKNQQLFAMKYLPYLPTETELVAEIERAKLMIWERPGSGGLTVLIGRSGLVTQ